VAIEDNFKARGRKKAEEHLPNLLQDIVAIVDGWSQTDPTFRTTRLYTRITAREVRQQLLAQKGYTGRRIAHRSDDQRQNEGLRLSFAQGQKEPAEKENPGDGRYFRAIECHPYPGARRLKRF